ncbi:MAG: alpha/beta fold hydrolase [Desulfobacterota bacterium]|jgi:pimeloyl-ACP methyl ester carboxylesterase|nr:alpha/beta fold hydrolase [Thermodesulfobacteriota bacterium]
MPQAKANNIHIEYDTFGNPSARPILLIAGLSAQLIYWDEEFCKRLAQAGLYVIRFDNRDAGLSTKLDSSGVPDMSDILRKLMSRQKVTPPYTIEDMASDAVGLLNALNIQKAHLCGMSMGGMIAQSLAIHYPQRVLSLTSIYSTTGNPQLPQPKPEVMSLLLTPPPRDRDLFVRFEIDLFRALTGPRFGFDEKWIRETMGKAYDRSYYPQGTGRQLVAVMTQSNRKAALRDLKVPTLIIHGDSDPLVSVEAAKDAADAVQGAELIILEGMGHDLPHGEAWAQIADHLIAHTKKAG